VLAANKFMAVLSAARAAAEDNSVIACAEATASAVRPTDCDEAEEQVQQ